MKYEKRTNRMIAMALAASMVTTMVPVTAFAEGEGEGGSTTTTTSNPDGSTTTTTTNSDGSSTSTTTSTSGEGTKAEPTVKVEVTVTVDANGDKTAVGDKTTTSYSDTDSFGNTTDSTTTTENWATGADVPTPPVEDNRTDEQKTQDFVDSFKDGSSETTNTTGTTGTETTSKTDVHNIYGEHTKDAGSVEGSETKTDTETTVEQKLDSEKYKDENVTGEYEIVGADKDGKPTPEDVVEDLGDFEKTDGSEGNPLPSTDPMMPGADMDLTNENTDLSATVSPGDKTDTDVKTWADWKNAYDKMVSDAEAKVKNAAAAEAGVDVGAGVYDADKGTTTYTKVTANDETGEKVEKVVVVKKNVDAKTGDITFTMETTIITTPADSAAVKNEGLSGITDPESVYSYDYENKGVIASGEKVVKTNVHLPQKPDPTDETDKETGRRRVTTVEDIVDENNPDQVIGYKVISTIYDENGDVVGGGEEKMMGEVTTTTTTTEVKKTTTIDTYTQETVVTEKTITKDVTTKTVVIDMEEVARKLTLNWLGGEADDDGSDIEGAILTWKSLQPDADKYSWLDPEEGDYKDYDQPISDATNAQLQYIKHVLGGYININQTDDSATWAYIYRLIDKNNQTPDAYGYCVDFATHAEKGYFYEIENIDDQTYYKNNYDGEALRQIAAIALNGFWATTNDSDTGSLAKVGTVLKNHLISEGWSESAATAQANSLTAAEALSGTQAAIWKYGNKGTVGIDTDYVSPNYNVRLLFDALTDTSLQTTSQNNATNILDEKDITSASITVRDKVQADKLVNTYAKDINSDNNSNNDVFDTDVSFTLAVIPDASDNLHVYVLDGNGNTVKQEALDRNKFDQNNQYTISGVQLQENVEITVNISGAQVLDKGVYIYTSEVHNDKHSQSFVTVAEGSRKVNLDVNLTFDVKDPDISESGEYDTWNGEKTQRTTSKINRHKQDKVVTAMMEITTETVTTTEHEWQESYEETWSPNHNGGGELGGDELEETEPTTPDPTPEKPTPEDPGKVAGDEEELQDIGDEEAPLDDLLLGDEEIVAATGDSNNMTAAAGGMFAALAGMLFLRKKKEN